MVRTRKRRHRPHALTRLIMVAASAWRLPSPERPHPEPAAKPRQLSPGPAGPDEIAPRLAPGHGGLLRRLLAPDAAGNAWISRDVQGREVRYLHCATLAAQTLIAELDQQVGEVCGELRGPVRHSPARQRAQLDGLRHRVVMDLERLHALTGTGTMPDTATGTEASTRTGAVADGDRPEPHRRRRRRRSGPQAVAFDLRFDSYLDGPICHLSLSVWSARPLHARYLPDEWRGSATEPRPIPVNDLPRYAETVHALLRETRGLIGEHLPEPELWVYQRRHVPPIFWIPVPAWRETDPGEYRTRQAELRQHLAGILLELGHPDDCVSTQSVIDGEFDVLRRFRRGKDITEPAPAPVPDHLRSSRAHYLIIPAEPARVPGTDDAGRRWAYQEQEDRTAILITRLTDLEARGASHLDDVHRDLEIWRSHLDVHNAVVERAAFLWDGLATHLFRRRTRIRRAVELLHQFLMQGIGNLAHLEYYTRECVARIQTAADGLHTAYDDQLTERHPEQVERGLRGALAQVGLFEKVTQHGQQTREEATRVKAIYDDLLRAVGYAFDEWRVRESDVVQRLSAGLGVVLALLGIVAVLDATVDLKPPEPASGPTLFGLGFMDTAGLVASWTIGGLLLFTVSYVTVLWFRISRGRLGSRRFLRDYTGPRRWSPRHRRDTRSGMWRLLKDMSTDQLEVAWRRYEEPRDAAGRGDPRAGQDAWARLDDELAGRFARLWDRAAAMNGPIREDDLERDVKALSRRIEQWGMHALLVTERAWQLHRYRLPKLACMYLGCTRLPGSFLTGPASPAAPRNKTPAQRADPPSMIGLSEFALVLVKMGVTREQAENLDRWLHNRQPQTARHLLELITSTGLAANMDPTAVRDLPTWIEEDGGNGVRRDEPPRYPQAYADDLKRHLDRIGLTGWDPAGQLCTGRPPVQTPERRGRPYAIQAWLHRAPGLHDLGPLLRHRLRHPRRTVVLVSTGGVSAPVRLLGRLARIRVHAVGWLPAVAGGTPDGTCGRT